MRYSLGEIAQAHYNGEIDEVEFQRLLDLLEHQIYLDLVEEETLMNKETTCPAIILPESS